MKRIEPRRCCYTLGDECGGDNALEGVGISARRSDLPPVARQRRYWFNKERKDGFQNIIATIARRWFEALTVRMATSSSARVGAMMPKRVHTRLGTDAQRWGEMPALIVIPCLQAHDNGGTSGPQTFYKEIANAFHQ